MTDTEIIKTLKCCRDGACYTKECPLIDIGEDSVIRCVSKLCELCLDLINRQKAKNESLEVLVLSYGDCVTKTRAEAIREFAERLKEKIDFIDTTRELKKTINNLVKEMTEGSNE